MHRRRRTHRVCPKGTTLEQARRFEAKLRQDLFRVIDLGEAPDVSLSKALARYVDEEVSRHKAAKITAQKVQHMQPLIAGRALSEIVAVAAKLVESERGRRKPGTTNRKLAILKRVATLSYKKWGWLKEPLGDKIALLPGEVARQTYLDAAQVRELHAACKHQSTKDAVLIAAYTGLRLSELWSITADMVRDNAVYLPDSKSGAPRAVPIIGKIRPAVRRWVTTERVPQDTFYFRFIAARKAAGFEHVTFHDLRHSCASMLVNAGVDLFVIGQILGHARPATTQRYSHLALETKRRAMGKLR